MRFVLIEVTFYVFSGVMCLIDCDFDSPEFDELSWLVDMSEALAAEGFADSDAMARVLLESRRHPEQVCSMEDVFAEFGL